MAFADAAQSSMDSLALLRFVELQSRRRRLTRPKCSGIEKFTGERLLRPCPTK